jgi:hypothetical protein
MPDAYAIYRSGVGAPLYVVDPGGSYLVGADFVIGNPPVGCTMFMLDSVSASAYFPTTTVFPDLPLTFTIGWGSLTWSYPTIRTYGDPVSNCFSLLVHPQLVMTAGTKVEVIMSQTYPSGDDFLYGTYPEFLSVTWGGHFI